MCCQLYTLLPPLPSPLPPPPPPPSLPLPPLPPPSLLLSLPPSPPLLVTAQLEHELSERDNRIAELRHALTMLDKDHDSLRADADVKDETIAQLRQQAEEQVSFGNSTSLTAMLCRKRSVNFLELSLANTFTT